MEVFRMASHWGEDPLFRSHGNHQSHSHFNPHHHHSKQGPSDQVKKGKTQSQRHSEKSLPCDPEDLRRRLYVVLSEQTAREERRRRARESVAKERAGKDIPEQQHTSRPQTTANNRLSFISNKSNLFVPHTQEKNTEGQKNKQNKASIWSNVAFNAETTAGNQTIDSRTAEKDENEAQAGHAEFVYAKEAVKNGSDKNSGNAKSHKRALSLNLNKIAFGQQDSSTSNGNSPVEPLRTRNTFPLGRAIARKLSIGNILDSSRPRPATMYEAGYPTGQTDHTALDPTACRTDPTTSYSDGNVPSGEWVLEGEQEDKRKRRDNANNKEKTLRKSESLWTLKGLGKLARQTPREDKNRCVSATVGAGGAGVKKPRVDLVLGTPRSPKTAGFLSKLRRLS